MKLETIKTKKPAQAEYDYFALAKFPNITDTRQVIVKPIDINEKNEKGIYVAPSMVGDKLPCGYVLASNDKDILPGMLVFWSTMSTFQKFEVADLKEYRGEYIMMITHNIIYYFDGK
jgi:hypothetical protein